MSSGPQPGDLAPDFTMPTAGGASVRLADLKGKIVVLYFYPKDDTSGCTQQALSFTENAAQFSELDAIVIGVSRDTVASHERFRDKHSLGITLASDADGAVTEAYGVWVEKSMYGKKYMGIERSTYLIGRDGTVLQVWRKVKVSGHVAAVLSAIAAK
jgi:thioredoxin-dependent peroxiredoxin